MAPDLDDIALLTVGEAADIAGVAVSTVKAWLARGQLQRHRVGCRVLVSERELLDCEKDRRDTPRGRPRAQRS